MTSVRDSDEYPKPLQSWQRTRSDYPNIALVGKMGSGKSTAKDLLLDEEAFGYNWIRFAGALRDTVENLWGPEYRENRHLLQSVGHGLRQIDADVWVNKLIRDLDPHVTPPPYVVDDCRYENEVYLLKAEGFTTVRIVAPRALRIQRLKENGRWTNEDTLDHESETALDDTVTDFTIDNTGTKFDLWVALVDVIRVLRRAVLPA